MSPTLLSRFFLHFCCFGSVYRICDIFSKGDFGARKEVTEGYAPSGFNEKAICGLLQFVEGCYEDLQKLLEADTESDS